MIWPRPCSYVVVGLDDLHNPLLPEKGSCPGHPEAAQDTRHLPGHVDTHAPSQPWSAQGDVGSGAHWQVSRAGFKENVENDEVNRFSFLVSFSSFLPSFSSFLPRVPAKDHVPGTVLDTGDLPPL